MSSHHATLPYTLVHARVPRTQRHTLQVCNHPAHFLTISSLSFPTPPSLHVILCHSPCAKLHGGELPQYWGIVSYTGNFLPRCQAYFTLICLQRLLIKQPCLYTYLYHSPACATLHMALNSMLLNIYLHWMSTKEEKRQRGKMGGGEMSLVGVLAVSICCKEVWEKFHISYWNVLGYHDAISMFSACFSGEKNIYSKHWKLKI